MEQRPAILQWKVALALFGVVAIGVTLGSVLHSAPKQEHKLYAVVTLQRAAPFRSTPVTGTVPTNQCKAFKAIVREATPADKPALRMLMKEACRKPH